MERAQVIALAVIVAALALFGIGYVVDGSALQARDDDVVAGALGDRSRPGIGIGLANRETRVAPRRAAAPGPAGSRRSSGVAGAAARPMTTAMSAAPR